MAVPSLKALATAGHEVAVVITRADKRRGRGSDLSPTPVKAAALELDIPVSHQVADVTKHGAELAVVVAFGRLIPADLLTPPEGVLMVNSHYSLLPRWRGAAPIERAILAGDHETGVCLMQLEAGLDAGPIYDAVRVPILPRATADELRQDLIAAGVEQLVRCLSKPLPTPVAQQGEPVYAAKIQPDELRIDWTRSAIEIDRLIRVGGAWTTLAGKRVKVLAVDLDPAFGEPRSLSEPIAGLRLTTVQPEGKQAMSFADFERGSRVSPGERFQ